MSQELYGDYDIFISYPTGFRTHARKLYDKLTLDHGYKCWLDDIEANPAQSVDDYSELKERPLLNISVLAEAINNSKVFLCCVTKEYCMAKLNIDEINHARNIAKPMVILSIERLTIVELGGVGFIIGPLIRVNAYKFKPDFFDDPTGNLMKQVQATIEAKLHPPKTQEINESKDPNQIFLRTLNAQTSAILCMTELEDNRIACGSSDGTVVVWDLSKVKESQIDPQRLEKHIDSITSLKKLPENRLASSSIDSNIVIWDLTTYKPITVLSGHTDGVLCLKLLPNNQLCSGSCDFTLRIWDTKSYKCTKEIIGPVKLHIKMFRNVKYHTNKFISSYIYKPYQEQNLENKVQFRKNIENEDIKLDYLAPKEANKKAEEETPNPISAPVQSISITDETANQNTENKQKNRFGAALLNMKKNIDEAVDVQENNNEENNDVQEREKSKENPKPRGLLGSKLMEMQKKLEVNSDDDEDEDEEQENNERNKLKARRLNLHNIDQNINRNSSEDEKEKKKKKNDDDEEEDDDTPEDKPQSKMKQFASKFRLKKNTERDESDEEDNDENDEKKKPTKKSSKLNGHSKLVYCLKVIKPHKNSERTRFASGSYDTLIKIWDLKSYDCVSTLKGHGGKILCLKNLPKHRLASAATDGTIRIWEMDNYTCIKTLSGHNSIVQSIDLLPNNKLISGSFDKTFRLWNLHGTKFECIKVYKEHNESVNIVKKFGTDRLITACNENIIKVWNIKNTQFECIQTFRDHGSWISQILPLNKGNLVCSCSWDGSVKVWTPITCT